MLIQVCKNGAGGRRILVLAPETPGMPDLEATADGGELSYLQQEITGVHIDALIGTVAFTGRGSLADALRDGNYTDLVLVTHGDGEHAQLTRETVSWQDLARLLSQHKVKLVIAMTCDSERFAEGLIASGVPQVICTRGDIKNRDARDFMREFIHTLARGVAVSEGVKFARSRMTPEGAGQVVLLPDEGPTTNEDAAAQRLMRLEYNLEGFRQEMRKCLETLNETLAANQKQHSADMKNVIAAMVAMTEVLAR